MVFNTYEVRADAFDCMQILVNDGKNDEARRSTAKIS